MKKKMKKKNDNSLRSLYSKKVLNKIDEKINLLGVSSRVSTLTFLNIRLITMIVLGIVVFVSFDYGYVYVPFVMIIYYILFEKIFLNRKIKKRTEKLNSEAIYFFEVLTLSLQTGRNLNEAISVTINSVDGELSLEFKEAIRQTGYLGEQFEVLLKKYPNIKFIDNNNIKIVLIILFYLLLSLICMVVVLLILCIVRLII